MLHLVGCVSSVRFRRGVGQMHAAGNGWTQIRAVVVGRRWLRCNFSEWSIMQNCWMRVWMVMVVSELIVLGHCATCLIRIVRRVVCSGGCSMRGNIANSHAHRGWKVQQVCNILPTLIHRNSSSQRNPALKWHNSKNAINWGNFLVDQTKARLSVVLFLFGLSS